MNKKAKADIALSRRQERRFSTDATFVSMRLAALGMMGSLSLGAGVFGMWMANPQLSWASYLVAAGGSSLGVSLWFGQPRETAVTVGDAGIGAEDGHGMQRVPWFQLRSIHVKGASMIVEGDDSLLSFSLAANRRGAAYALAEAKKRVPDVIDVANEIFESLPDPQKVGGYRQDIGDDQVAGMHCVKSGELIHLEEDARICPRCAQVFHKDATPTSCPTCDARLEGKALLA